MRDAIREYIDLSSAEKNELWKNATFIFDTNVFLNLYRYTKKTRDIMSTALTKGVMRTGSVKACLIL